MGCQTKAQKFSIKGQDVGKKNNKALLLTTAYVAGAAFVRTFVSSAAGSIRAQAYRATHGEEYWQGTEVIRGLNFMA